MADINQNKPSEAAPYYSSRGLPCPPGVRPDVFNLSDIEKMAPALAKHPKLVNAAFRFLAIDEVNAVHGRYCDVTGGEFAHCLINDEFKNRLRIDNEDILARFPEGPFITVSNHPYGGFDGIMLIDLVCKYRKDYQVMVNLILNNLSALRPAFIAVDPIKTGDPEKVKVTMQGIRRAMAHVKEGHPLGFFPAGAVSKLDSSLHVRDREWQPSVIRLIRQLRVPVIPIYFHGHNSAFFNFLGLIDWRIRSARLPREIFNKRGKEMHISIGEPIMPEEIAAYKDLDALGKMLREKTYSLASLR